MRSLVLLAAAAVTATLAPCAGAQVVEIYGTFSPTHASNVSTGTTQTTTGYTYNKASFWASGFGGGLTVNGLHLPFVRLGLDLRGSSRPGTTGYDTAMAGLKLTFRPPLLRLKPYVQASGGYLATRTPNTSTYSAGTQSYPVGGTFTNQYGAYEILGGIDTPILPFIDFRIVEIGGGKGFAVISSNGTENATLFTVNTGLVFHF